MNTHSETQITHTHTLKDKKYKQFNYKKCLITLFLICHTLFTATHNNKLSKLHMTV